MAYTNITKGQPDWDTTINNNFQQVQTDLATDETLTTVHNLTLQSGFAGTAKLITYMLGGVARVALRIAVSPSTAQTLDATVPIVVAPDITSDPAAIAGGRKMLIGCTLLRKFGKFKTQIYYSHSMMDTDILIKE